jgi:hypothetical protein
MMAVKNTVAMIMAVITLGKLYGFGAEVKKPMTKLELGAFRCRTIAPLRSFSL